VEPREVEGITTGCPVDEITLGLGTESEGGLGGGNGGMGSPSVGATTFGLRNCSVEAATPPTVRKFEEKVNTIQLTKTTQIPY
jgi:hypothetical protein